MAKKKTTIDDLVILVKKGFDHTDSKIAYITENMADKASVNKRFDAVDRRFDVVEKRLDHIDARISYVERDVAEIRKHFVYRDEFEDALARLRLVEKKLGIKS